MLLPTLVNYRVRYRTRETLRVKRRENRKHFEKIRRSDAILVLNYPTKKNAIPRDSIFREELQVWGAETWHD